jgi:hypothetical protein
VNDAAADALARILEQFGRGLLAEPTRLRSLLFDEAPDARREITALLHALDERVPDDLIKSHAAEPIGSLAPRLAKRLADRTGLAREAADWAVRAWAKSLGIGLGAAAAAAAPSSDAARSQDEWGETEEQQAAKRRGGDRTTDRIADRTTHRTTDRIADRTTDRTANRTADRTTRAGLAPTQRRAIAIVAAAAAAIGIWWWQHEPPLEITRVEMAEPFVGDGKRREVMVDFDAGGRTVRTIEVRFVQGDGKWTPPNWTANVAPDASARNRASAGTLHYSGAQAARATFAYVLVTADGRRSAPFEKTWEILAPPSSAPRISGITVPNPIYVGRDFALTVAFEDADADVAKMERRVVESSSPWPQELSVVELSGVQGRKSGTFPYRFQAAKGTSRSTLEFVLIDSRGNRSEPRRVTIDIVAAPERGAPAAVEDRPQAPGGGARLAVASVNSAGGGVEVAGRYSAAGLAPGRCEVQASVYDSSGRPLAANPSFGRQYVNAQGFLAGRHPVDSSATTGAQDQPFRIAIPLGAFPHTLSAMRPPLQLRSAIVCDGRPMSNVVQSQFARPGG